MKKIIYSTYVVFFEVPILMMFLSNISGVNNMIANYERNQICKLVQQRNEAITMKVMPEQIQEKGETNNDEVKNNTDNNRNSRLNYIMVMLENGSHNLYRRSCDRASDQITGLI